MNSTIMSYIKNTLLNKSIRRQEVIEMHMQNIQYILKLLTEASNMPDKVSDSETNRFTLGRYSGQNVEEVRAPNLPSNVRIGKFVISHCNGHNVEEMEFGLTEYYFQKLKPGSLIRVLAFVQRNILAVMIYQLKSSQEIYIFDRLGQYITDSIECLHDYFEYITKKFKNEEAKSLFTVAKFSVEIETTIELSE
jgi:hypothetical protein